MVPVSISFWELTCECEYLSDILFGHGHGGSVIVSHGWLMVSRSSSSCLNIYIYITKDDPYHNARFFFCFVLFCFFLIYICSFLFVASSLRPDF